MGGLFISIFGIAKFILSGYQLFVQDKSMLKMLYAEQVKNRKDVIVIDESDSDPDNGAGKDQEKREDGDGLYTRDMKQTLDKRKEFRMSYLGYVWIYLLETFCCCFKKCCFRKESRCQRMMDSYKKFEVA
jgi:hypothetical protein